MCASRAVGGFPGDLDQGKNYGAGNGGYGGDAYASGGAPHDQSSNYVPAADPFADGGY